MTDFVPTLTVTGEQIRAARAMLRLDQRQFATLTHTTVGTVRRMERTHGPVNAALGLLEAMRVALEDAGLEFIEPGHYQGIGGPGVRMKGEPITTGDVIDFDEAVEEMTPEERAVSERP